MWGWIAGIVALETASIVWLRRHMERRGWKGYSWGVEAAFYNNLLYGIFSVIFFCAYSATAMFAVWSDGVEHGWQLHTLLDFGREQRQSLQVLLRVYLGSKVWEFQDLVWVYLGGMKPALTMQFHFHHLTTLPLTALSYATGIFGEFWMVASNSLAHIFVYFFFAGLRSDRMVRCMMVFGTLQLVVGIGFSSAAMVSRCLQGCSDLAQQIGRQYQPTAELMTWILYSCYAMLWFHDILVSRAQRQEAAKRGGQASSRQQH